MAEEVAPLNMLDVNGHLQILFMEQKPEVPLDVLVRPYRTLIAPEQHQIRCVITNQYLE